MEKSSLLIASIAFLLLISRSNGDARTQVIKVFCDEEIHNDDTYFVPNYVQAMEIVSTEMQTSHNATVEVGTGPNTNYVLAQCYNDLSSQDCMLCYAETRTVFPSCYPRNGGRIYLDGCFMRLQNYSFYEEYTGSYDTIVCGNITRESVEFQNSTKQAVLNVVADALSNDEYFGRGEVVVVPGNKSVYVMAECWRTLSPGNCRKCLENASEVISKCLPWSEGRALNTGCFMRYSDTNFLNPIQQTGGSKNKGKNIGIEMFLYDYLIMIYM